MGVLLFYLGLLPLQELMVVARATAHREPDTLLWPVLPCSWKNALGFAVATGTSVPATTPTSTWLAFALIVVVALTFGDVDFSSCARCRDVGSHAAHNAG